MLNDFSKNNYRFWGLFCGTLSVAGICTCIKEQQCDEVHIIVVPALCINTILMLIWLIVG